MTLPERPAERIYWVDTAKVIAILAVLADHTYVMADPAIGLFYSNSSVVMGSYFSVSLFILVMGITAYWSFRRNKNLPRKITKILIPYLAASFFYCVYRDKAFLFENYIQNVIHFDACMPFYYVIVYLQLIIISPVLYAFFQSVRGKRFHFILETGMFLVVLFIASLSVKFTDIMGIYGGGGKLFGGTYLVLFYIGMWFAQYEKNIHLKTWQYCIGASAALSLSILWWRFMLNDRYNIDSYLPFGPGYNPPSITLSAHALLILAFCYFLDGALKPLKNNNLILQGYKKISLLGKHTLYIFLYHVLFAFLIIDLLKAFQISIVNYRIINLLFYFVLIAGPVFLEVVFGKARRIVEKCYKGFF